MRGHVDPKGSIAVHEGERPYVLYVISGTGKLSLNDKAGSAKSRTRSWKASSNNS
jgi:quercetin dioxygenase-like cupin family protein